VGADRAVETYLALADEVADACLVALYGLF